MDDDDFSLAINLTLTVSGDTAVHVEMKVPVSLNQGSETRARKIKGCIAAAGESLIEALAQQEYILYPEMFPEIQKAV